MNQSITKTRDPTVDCMYLFIDSFIDSSLIVNYTKLTKKCPEKCKPNTNMQEHDRKKQEKRKT